MKDYVGGTVTIRENYIETNLPLGRWKLKNPIYKLEKQNEEDFWEQSHANIHSGFGFKSEKKMCIRDRCCEYYSGGWR